MAKKIKRVASQLEKALDFLLLTNSGDSEQALYAFMEMGEAVSYNMTVAAGTKIDIDLAACPQMDLLHAAMQRCGEQFAITQLVGNKIVVRSADFHAFIPCAGQAQFDWPSPDVPIAPMGNDFLTALKKVAPFSDAKAETVLEAAIQLLDGSVLATNRSVVVEAWHGVSMPEGLLLPVVAAKVLQRAKKDLQSFGYSGKTITFHFTDGCWLQSRLFQDRLPSIKAHIEKASQANMHEVPHDLFAAVEKVAPFSTSGKIWIEGNLVSSHPFDDKEHGSGLTLQFDGQGHALRIYSLSDLHKIRKLATKWDEFGREDGTLFFGEKIRGMIWHETIRNGTAPSNDEDIPF